MNRRTALITGAAALVAPALPASATPRAPMMASGSVQSYRYYLFPSLLRSEAFRRYVDPENNWITIENFYMDMGDVKGELSRYNIPVNSPLYGHLLQRWRAEREPEPVLPPHISFGGALEPGNPDPTFHARWERVTAERIRRSHPIGIERPHG